MNISIIVAVARNNVIGKDNKLIWHLPADLKRFKKLTVGHHIIMGRKTFESIGKPLPDRVSIVITHQQDFQAKGCIVANSFEEALSGVENDDEVFVIGGESIYKEALEKANKIYLTQIHRDFKGDTFFSPLEYTKWESVAREDYFPDEKNPYPYSFINLQRKF